MPAQSKEARILMAIEALKSDPKLSVWRVARTYDAPGNTLCNKMNSTMFKAKTQLQNQLLTKLGDKVLLEHIVNLPD